MIAHTTQQIDEAGEDKSTKKQMTLGEIAARVTV